MRIALLFPSIYASTALFPDKIFAPRDLCIALVNGLVARGHDVTVYSVADLPVSTRVISVEYDVKPYYKFRGLQESKDEEFAKHEFEIKLITRCFDDAREGKLDLIHVYHESSLFLSHHLNHYSAGTPVVYTLHDPLPPKETYEYKQFTQFADHAYVAISENFKNTDLPLNFVGTVHHGIDTDAFVLGETPGNHVLFLGRLTHEKGLHVALKAAIATQTPIVVSSNFPKPGEVNAYYSTLLSSMHHPLVTKYPVVDKKQRIELYRGAQALLFPIVWEEPFGMVMIESMACGTPVIAYNHGSVPEIVRDGVTGFILDSDDGYTNEHTGTWSIKKRGQEGLAEAIGKIKDIDRRACRAHVVQHFSVEKMVKGYEQVYATVIESTSKAHISQS